MNFTIEQILSIIAAIGGSVLSIAAAWFNFKNQLEKLIDRDNDQSKSIGDLWAWKHSHEKESFVMRETFQKELARLEGHNMVTNEQFKQILSMLTDIKVRMEKIEDHQRRKE